MARTPGTTKDETHERIVGVAAKALRRDGYGGTGVAAVMKEAGLTHGGFYAHFKSREALLIEAQEQAGRESQAVMTRAIADAPKGVSPFRALVETYLAEAHLAKLEIGCPIAALGCDMPRQSKAVRQASARGVQQLITAVHRTLPPPSSDRTAIAIAGTLVGTLQLARTLGNSVDGRKVLAAGRTSLLQLHDTR